MLSLEDSTMLADFADEEARQPSLRQRINDFRSVYQSRKFRKPLGGKNFGLPILCDFGEAVIGKVHESGPFVQPTIYRAPEVIFEMPWGSAVDIWNLGALVSRVDAVSSVLSSHNQSQIWDLFEGQQLFADIFDSNGNHDPFKHLALMFALVGPPPAKFVQRSETTGQCFDDNGERLHLNFWSLSRSILLQAPGSPIKMRLCH